MELNLESTMWQAGVFKWEKFKSSHFSLILIVLRFMSGIYNSGNKEYIENKEVLVLSWN